MSFDPTEVHIDWHPRSTGLQILIFEMNPSAWLFSPMQLLWHLRFKLLFWVFTNATMPQSLEDHVLVLAPDNLKNQTFVAHEDTIRHVLLRTYPESSNKESLCWCPIWANKSSVHFLYILHPHSACVWPIPRTLLSRQWYILWTTMTMLFQVVPQILMANFQKTHISAGKPNVLSFRSEEQIWASELANYGVHRSMHCSCLALLSKIPPWQAPEVLSSEDPIVQTLSTGMFLWAFILQSKITPNARKHLFIESHFPKLLLIFSWQWREIKKSLSTTVSLALVSCSLRSVVNFASTTVNPVSTKGSFKHTAAHICCLYVVLYPHTHTHTRTRSH